METFVPYIKYLNNNAIFEMLPLFNQLLQILYLFWVKF